MTMHAIIVLTLATLGLLTLAGVLVEAVRLDRPARPPRSHGTDPSFLPPGSRDRFDRAA